ncbi:hypothetical protein [Bacillus phage Anath]|uniref:Uncharacterized protein n=1 Tax=Bacillus phage Anath TaxID=2108114 RepID=A0A2P1JUN4_9CAUD|nr:hypothetical protein [Bacillus phage Anath]
MKKVKSVAFQLADPMEFKLFHFAMKNSYFSTYVKRLIQRDMELDDSMLGDGWKKAFEQYLQDPDKYFDSL